MNTGDGKVLRDRIRTTRAAIARDNAGLLQAHERGYQRTARLLDQILATRRAYLSELLSQLPPGDSDHRNRRGSADAPTRAQRRLIERAARTDARRGTSEQLAAVLASVHDENLRLQLQREYIGAYAAFTGMVLEGE